MEKDETVDTYFYVTGWIIGAIILTAFALCKIGKFSLSSFMPPCTLHIMTGYYCPGCGGTRAMNALFHGKIFQSFLYQPFIVYAVGVGGWFMLSQTIQRISRGKLHIGMHYRNIYLWVGLELIALNFLIKNAVLLLWGIPLME